MNLWQILPKRVKFVFDDLYHWSWEVNKFALEYVRWVLINIFFRHFSDR